MDGITPACAGNRHTTDTACHGIGDHPRLRGEQCMPFADCITVIGSPPLARGTVLVSQRGGGKFRITPACAGNSTSERLCLHAV